MLQLVRKYNQFVTMKRTLFVQPVIKLKRKKASPLLPPRTQGDEMIGWTVRCLSHSDPPSSRSPSIATFERIDRDIHVWIRFQDRAVEVITEIWRLSEMVAL